MRAVGIRRDPIPSHLERGLRGVAALLVAAIVALAPLAAGAAATAAAAAPAPAPAATAAAPAANTPPEATLRVANREIVTLRALLLDITPRSRVERAELRLATLTERDLADPVRAIPATLGELHGYSILVGDRLMFSMLPGDLDPEEGLTLDQAAERARANLAGALAAMHEQRKLPVLLRGLAHALGVSVLLGAFLWVFNRMGRKLIGAIEAYRDRVAALPGRLQMRAYVARLVVRLLQLGRWLIIVVLLYAWLTYVFDHFPYTEPLAGGLVRFVVTLLRWLADGILASIPGIVTVAIILFVARAVVEVIGQFFEGVQAGRTQVPFLYRETAGATRRIVTLVAWVLALAVAYPFIPGSGSDAFKGLSVLFGVMLSLGSTGLVTQMMSGLVIVYSRALHKGDFVSVNGVEGVVMEIGTLATKVVTMRSEEVTIPNSVLVSSPIRNYSTLIAGRGALLTTKVTIGYDAPWRQVHALLLQAAGRTEGLREDPAPYVFQRALSDFYVEYELFAYSDRPLERVAILSALHANIQDAFNEHGVQIMSPHFVLQPREPVIVPPDQWAPPPAGGTGSA